MIMIVGPDLQVLLSLVLAVVLPLLVGLVTKHTSSAGAKSVLLALLSAVAGLGTELANALDTGTSYNLVTGLITWVVTFVIAVATHYGVWKPTGATELVQAVGSGEAKHRAETN